MGAPRARGFTLIEVMIALVMLAIVTLSLMTMSSRMIRGVTDDRARTLAAAAADARIALARQWPSYTALDSLGATESDTPLPGWTRTTTVRGVGGPGLGNDFKRVTVEVSGPGLPVPLARTISLAAP